jgi:periplasmic copper chaperone A
VPVHAVGFLGIVLLVLASGGAAAHEFARGDVTVAHPWARATPGGAKVGGAYLEIKATGKGDRLIAAHSPVAGKAEIHNHIMEGNIARMRRVEAIPVAGGKSVVLEPSGYHVMLMDLKQPLKEGDLIKLTLVFERAGEIEVDATVEPIGAMGPHGFDHQPGAKKKPPGGAHKH